MNDIREQLGKSAIKKDAMIEKLRVSIL